MHSEVPNTQRNSRVKGRQQVSVQSVLGDPSKKTARWYVYAETDQDSFPLMAAFSSLYSGTVLRCTDSAPTRAPRLRLCLHRNPCRVPKALAAAAPAFPKWKPHPKFKPFNPKPPKPRTPAQAQRPCRPAGRPLSGRAAHRCGPSDRALD